MSNPNDKENASASGVASSDLFGDFWKVAVLIRRANKSLFWQIRCAFKIEAEALDYVGRWNGLTQCKIIPPNVEVTRGADQKGDLKQ